MTVDPLMVIVLGVTLAALAAGYYKARGGDSWRALLALVAGGAIGAAVLILRSLLPGRKRDAGLVLPDTSRAVAEAEADALIANDEAGAVAVATVTDVVRMTDHDERSKAIARMLYQ